MVALAAPAEGRAHGGAPVKALDFEARVTSVGGARGIVDARAVDGDRKLELRVEGTQTVVVLGYGGEPFLRFTAAGVAVNERSLTAITNRLAKRGSIPALGAHVTPVWSLTTTRHSFAWHDHRLGPRPGQLVEEGDVGGWTVPIVVDGRGDRIVGRLRHARGPPLWPWLLLLGVTLAIAAMLARTRRRRPAEAVAIAGAALACASVVLVSSSVTLAPGRASAGAWGSVAVACVVATVSLIVLVVARPVRVAVAGLIALFAELVAVGYLGVLVHGYVIASLPAAVVRVATAVAVSCGLLGVVAVAVVLVMDRHRPVRARSSVAGTGVADVTRGRVHRR